MAGFSHTVSKTLFRLKLIPHYWNIACTTYLVYNRLIMCLPCSLRVLSLTSDAVFSTMCLINGSIHGEMMSRPPCCRYLIPEGIVLHSWTVTLIDSNSSMSCATEASAIIE